MLVASLSLLISVVIVVQDFKERRISAILILLLLILAAITGVSLHSWSSWVRVFTINAVIWVVQLLFLFVYFSIRAKRIVNIVDSFLGLGDILIMFVFAAFFSPINFLLFYFLSLAISVIGYGTYMALSKSANKEIPLAGLFSIVFSVLIIVSLLTGNSFLDDLPVLNYLWNV